MSSTTTTAHFDEAGRIALAWKAAVSSLTHDQPNGISKFDEAITTLRAFLKPRISGPPRPRPILVPIDVGEAFKMVKFRLSKLIFEVNYVVQETFLKLHETTMQRWRWPDQPSSEAATRYSIQWFKCMVEWFSPYQSLLASEDNTFFQTYSNHFGALLMSQLPRQLGSHMRALFHEHLTHHDPSTKSLLTRIHSHPTLNVLTMIRILQLRSFVLPLLYCSVYDVIEAKVEDKCQGQFAEEQRAILISWLRTTLFPKLEEVTSCFTTPSGTPPFARFEHYLEKSLAEIRIRDLFDIVVDFPESQPAILDLKECITSDLRKSVVQSLRFANSKRLLHPGADTRDIITQYISTIKALKVLDPPCVLLTKVAGPIRAYLRRREDTIRCVVESLVEPGHELEAELAAADEAVLAAEVGEEGDYFDPTWLPDPLDAPPDFRSTIRRDILESLVSIYDNQDGFIKELQVLLGQRLLAAKDFNIDREIMNVEILKKRFGESSLQPCNVMLKDIADSKRADNLIRKKSSHLPIRAIVASRLYWPNIATNSFKLPAYLTALHAAFENDYSLQKADKRLKWLPHLGTADIEVQLKDRTVRLETTLLQAALIGLFADSDSLMLDDIAKALKLENDMPLIKNSLFFWANQSILREADNDRWILLETKDTSNMITDQRVIEEVSVTVETAKSARIQQMRVFWAYISGMLTNLGTLPLDRMHATLNMLVKDFKGTTKEELRAFLEEMQREGSVEPVGTNSWKLTK